MNATTSPDGTQTADLITEDTAAATQHRIYDTLSFVVGEQYTLSAYVKRASGARHFALINVVGGSRIYFDLTNDFNN